ncbi:MAG: hypothetical protein EBS64_09850 [Verrucomicrobia bacterium]|nr:hypothetical protein [Verrucomicrobiota bacterium]
MQVGVAVALDGLELFDVTLQLITALGFDDANIIESDIKPSGVDFDALTIADQNRSRAERREIRDIG